MVKKKWTILSTPDPELVSSLSSDINIPISLAEVLVRRGVEDKLAAKKFFIPEITHLHDPFLMKDLDKAANRLLTVIQDKEDIMILGDYDVDGTSGVSMFYCFLERFGLKPSVYIPDRFTEGYGLSAKGIEHAASLNLKLIVVIDCGITAVDKVQYAKSLGIDIIVCDHHHPPDILPQAYAILDPLQEDCKYPFKYLCGTGVAFKLIQGICTKLGLDDYSSLLDFVAIATAADMVPVIGENRVLVHLGFDRIRRNPRASYRALIKNSGFRLEDLNTTGVVFGLGPRINAVGRLGSAARAVAFLTCDNLSQVESLASVLESENMNRKKIDSEIYSEAQSTYENARKGLADGDDVAIVLHNPEWHPGVLGIIASRMVEKYYKPSVILTTFNGTAKGSARSVNNFNIYDALKLCASACSAIVQFGGHSHAAGLEVEVERISEFRNTFNKVVKDLISVSELGDDIFVPEIKIESELSLSEIDSRFVKIIKSFEPFGPGNSNPVFISNSIQVVGEPRNYNGTNVFRIRNFRNDRPDEAVFDCLYYRSGGANDPDNIEIVRGRFYDIVYSIEENFWNDRMRTQLRLRDLRPASGSLSF